MKKIITASVIIGISMAGALVYVTAGNTTDAPTVVAQNVQDTNTFELIGPTEFEQKYDTGEYVVIDVRTPEEREGGTLIDRTLAINYYDQDFVGQLNELDKKQPYLIHCQSGNRSGKVAQIMDGLGFEEVYDLQGGKNAWVASGRDLVRE